MGSPSLARKRTRAERQCLSTIWREPPRMGKRDMDSLSPAHYPHSSESWTMYTNPGKTTRATVAALPSVETHDKSNFQRSHSAQRSSCNIEGTAEVLAPPKEHNLSSALASQHRESALHSAPFDQAVIDRSNVHPGINISGQLH